METRCAFGIKLASSWKMSVQFAPGGDEDMHRGKCNGDNYGRFRGKRGEMTILLFIFNFLIGILNHLF